MAIPGSNSGPVAVGQEWLRREFALAVPVPALTADVPGSSTRPWLRRERDFQNFVGETVGGYREEVHFICPRPQDVPGLMDAWVALLG